MPVVINPESEYGRELARWDLPRSQGGTRPDGFEPYPSMMYRPILQQGKAVCHDPVDESVGRACQRLVRSDDERAAAEKDGFRASPTLALEHYEALQQAIGNAAAEANYQATKMTSKAQAERTARDKATDKHLAE